nr:E3 ubiquitin-protein ligase UPL7 [Tanacetum cinerariifolium]
MYSLWGDPWFIIIFVSLNLNLDQRVILIVGVYLKHLYGGNHDIDVDDLRSNTKYSGGYIKGSRTVKLFWEVLREFEPKERCVLIKFEDNQDKVSYVLAQAGVKLQRLKAQLESVVVSFHYRSSTAVILLTLINANYNSALHA